MRAAGDRVHGRRVRGLIVVLWRAGVRISEVLSLGEADLDPRRGSMLVRRGKGGRRREVGMDGWHGSSSSVARGTLPANLLVDRAAGRSGGEHISLARPATRDLGAGTAWTLTIITGASRLGCLKPRQYPALAKETNAVTATLNDAEAS